MKNLGIVFNAGLELKCNFDHVKRKFYRAFNALYAKCSSSQFELTSVYLMQAFCIPILTYGIEAVILSNGTIKMLDSVIDNAVKKIFKVLKADSILAIRKSVGLHSIESIFYQSMCKFLMKFQVKPLAFAELLASTQLSYLKSVCNKFYLRFDGTLMCTLRDILRNVVMQL